MNRDYPLEKVRNIGIIAHKDASSRDAGLLRNPRFLTLASLAVFLRGETTVSPTPFVASMCANIIL